MFRHKLFMTLRALAFIMTFVAALFGVPLIIDPPPRPHITQIQTAEGSRGAKRPKPP